MTTGRLHPAAHGALAVSLRLSLRHICRDSPQARGRHHQLGGHAHRIHMRGRSGGSPPSNCNLNYGGHAAASAHPGPSSWVSAPMARPPSQLLVNQFLWQPGYSSKLSLKPAADSERNASRTCADARHPDAIACSPRVADALPVYCRSTSAAARQYPAAAPAAGRRRLNSAW